MAILIGVDLGTTKITSLALENETGSILALASTANDANITSSSDRARGRSEWQADRILAAACHCLADVSSQLGSRVRDVAGLGITGQQHGMLLVDSSLHPISPLINWQDRRALEPMPGSDSTWLTAARQAIGPEAWKRTGCHLHPGFMAVTLFELAVKNGLPSGAKALVIMDYFAAALTGEAPVTDPSCAGSSGVFDVRSRDWNHDAIEALGLSPSLFPEIREAHESVGGLTGNIAASTGLPVGTPVFAPIGDHQASFLGSVADRRNSVLINVGTGAQVAVYTDEIDFVPPIELRPFPCGGNLLSNVGLAGGWSYQVLKQFFEDVGRSLFQTEPSEKFYDQMNQLAQQIPSGADGLCCEPRFSGTRLDPAVRGSITGLSPQNFTAGHLARAVLEGMSRSLHDGFKAIQQVTNHSPTTLVAAGNGLRENPLLGEIVSHAFGLDISFTQHREEAAFGAALVASVGTNRFPSLEQAARHFIVTTTRPSRE